MTFDFDLAVVGLGYVGLPLARRACEVALSVAGYDIAAPVVANLAAGRSHVADVTDADVAAMLSAGFHPTRDASVLGRAETVVICVPTGLNPDGEPDLSAVFHAVRAVGRELRAGQLIVLESTTYAGTTEEMIRPILEEGGLVTGGDFYLGYSPERINPGSGEFELETTPKIVSGCTPLCVKRCVAFYEPLIETIVVAKGTREAEMAKLLENTFRDVNIALVNELATLCRRLGIDVWEVLRCAETKPFGFQAFRPGPGVGGHCIAVDPKYLARQAREAGVPCGLVEAARTVNARMPGQVVERAHQILTRDRVHPRDARVTLLGVSYKPDVGDCRESPALDVARGLLAAGSRVSYHDPHVPDVNVDGVTLPRITEPAAWHPRADLM
ncbi:MAG: nucleotide sugar dehydrogenase, partial [Stackebrandtia sp.]